MRKEASLLAALALCVAGCPNTHEFATSDTGVDSGGGGTDTGTLANDGGGTGTDGGAAMDGGGTGTDAATTSDGGGTGTDAGFGCGPMSGVDCDGDYVGRCTPGCSADQCCSPQNGHFMCMPRNADGTCPLADLFIDGTHIDGTGYAIEYQNFAADDCALVEGCVDGPGLRRLLRWDTWTPNQGQADMYLGATPARGVSSGPYVWSACHGHHHFNSYADYELLGSDGSQAAHGHKQAFCLLDYHPYPCGGAGQPACRYPDPAAVYTCGNQGIERGWQDVYERNLDCQWIDVTDVAPGDYQLHIALNTLHILPESDYTNNDLYVSVTIPPPPTGDITLACTSSMRGLGRECGWNRASDPSLGTCTPGASVTLGCSSGCGLGMCTGDTILRVCEGSHDPDCNAPVAIAQNDDSGCPGTGRCGTTGDCCSQVTFTCPTSGTYAAFWGPYTSGTAATCTLAAR